MSIDYGMGKTNIDTNTGIRYGVIQANKVDFWNDSTEFYYPEVCYHCGSNINYSENEIEDFEVLCPICENTFSTEESEPVSCFVKNDSIQAEQNLDSSDIFVFKSEYYTFCGFCSPCAPGAGYLTDQSNDCKAYCFGHDWFENDKAPYRVFRVSNDKEVFPPITQNQIYSALTNKKDDCMIDRHILAIAISLEKYLNPTDKDIVFSVGDNWINEIIDRCFSNEAELFFDDFYQSMIERAKKLLSEKSSKWIIEKTDINFKFTFNE